MDGVLEFIARYDIVGLAVALVVVAFVVNRWALTRRRRIRAGLVMYLLFLCAEGAEQVLGRAHFPGAAAWAEDARIAGALLGALIAVRLVSLVVFDVLLPAARITVVAINADLFVGLAYLLTTFGVLRASGVEATASLVTTSALVSGVVALSLQATLGNILGGVALQIDGSIHVGDWVQEGLEHLLHERPEIAESVSKTLAQREIGLDSIIEGLDDEARKARMAHTEGRILDAIQAFFGLERTMRV